MFGFIAAQWYFLKIRQDQYCLTISLIYIYRERERQKERKKERKEEVGEGERKSKYCTFII